MQVRFRLCRECGADISDKAPNAFKCDGCLAPRSGSPRSVTTAAAMRTDLLGSTNGFEHDTLTHGELVEARAINAGSSRRRPAAASRTESVSGDNRYDAGDDDDRVGYCVLVVFGFGIDTNDLDGHTNVLRVMDPCDVIAELGAGDRAVTDNDGRAWSVTSVADDEDPGDHCERIPVADIPVEDASAAVTLTDPGSGERRHAVAYCQAATVAQVAANRSSFAAAFGDEMPRGVLEWAERNPPGSPALSGASPSRGMSL